MNRPSAPARPKAADAPDADRGAREQTHRRLSESRSTGPESIHANPAMLNDAVPAAGRPS